jgi:alkanesulfonate monooxygenase SsuD/methylene tetrahydromethanopterin reductase-like flavin-dependent oxidoreductase (luciferase family)/alkylhydroperoxidase family enzyme
MNLDFGVFDHLDRNDLPLGEYYEQRLKVIEAFDRSGFYAYHVAEHHFTPLGMAPSPSVFLSAIGQRTTRLRFGTFVYALPLHHPLRVVEEICMLDHLSGGRLEIGFGRGSVPFEVAYYGQNAEERQQIYAERLALILKAFTGGTLTWHGRYDQFENVPMEIGPFQKPHPPLWYGAHSPDSAERAARQGLNIVMNDMPARVREIVERYRQVWHESQGAAALPKMGLVRFIVVADNDAAAMALARRAYLRWRSSFTYLSEMNGTMPDSPLRAESFDVLVAQGQAVAGSPETVRNFLAAQIEETGANYIVGQFCFGDLELTEMQRSVALFAAQVMPALQAAFKNVATAAAPSTSTAPAGRLLSTSTEPPLARVPLVPSDTQDPVIKPIFDGVRARGGEPLNMHRTMANAPMLFKSMSDQALAIRSLATVARADRELIILRMTSITGGDYEFTQHKPMAMSCGVTAGQIEAIAQRRSSTALFDARQRAILAYADAMASPAGVDDATFAALQKFFSPQEIVELTITAGFYCGAAMATRALAVKLEPNAGHGKYGSVS